MRMMSEAIEEASAFTEFRDQLLGREPRAVTGADLTGTTTEAAGLARQTGENRAEHRARLKRERREAKRAKATA